MMEQDKRSSYKIRAKNGINELWKTFPGTLIIFETLTEIEKFYFKLIAWNSN